MADKSTAVASAPRRRGVAVLLGTVAAVLAFAYLLVSTHWERRASELNGQYAATSAHVARQLELELDSYAASIGNLPVAPEEGLKAPAQTEVEREREKVAIASAAAYDAQARALQAKKRLDQARSFEASIPVENLQGAARQAKVQYEKLKGAADDAGRKAATAQETARIARATVEAAAGAVRNAEQALDNTLMSAPPTTGSPETEQHAPTPQPVPAEPAASLAPQAIASDAQAGAAAAPQPSIDALKDAVSKAKTRLKDAVDHATAKELEAKEAALREQSASAAALRAMQEYTVKANDTQLASFIKSLQEVEVQDAESTLKSLRVTSEARETELAAAHSQAQRLERAMADVLDKATVGVLPSQQARVKACLGLEGADGAPTAAHQVECIARSLADMTGLTGAPKWVRIVPCQDAGRAGQRGATLTSDRSTLQFPIRDRQGTPLVCANVDIRNLRTLSLHGERARQRSVGTFDQVLLIDPTGNVLASANPDFRARLSSVPEEFRTPDSGTGRAELLRVAGNEYYVYTQATDARVALTCEECGNADGALQIVGLVSKARIAKETRQLDPRVFLWVLLLLGSALMSLPLAKLWLVSADSRYGRFDTALLGTVGCVATLLFVLTAWAFHAHGALQLQVDQRLGKSARDLGKLLDVKLWSAARMLDKFAQEIATQNIPGADDPELGAPGRELHRRCSGVGRALQCSQPNAEYNSVAMWRDTTEGRHLFACEQVSCGQSALIPEAAKRTATAAPAPSHLHWQHAAWVDSSGRQRAKFTTAPRSTAPIHVHHRDYFKRTRDGTAGCLRHPWDAKARCIPAAVEVVQADTHGNIAFVLSQAISRHASDAASPASLGIATLSLMPPWAKGGGLILPRGFSYAIVDEQGRVMLHSDLLAQHGQNILDDVDDPDSLSAMFDAQETGRFVNLRYLGTPVRVHVSTLTGPRWHLLTIAPRNLVDLPVIGMVKATLLAYLGGAVIAALLIALLLLFARRMWSRKGAEHPVRALFRPDARRGAVYRSRAAYSLALSVVGIYCSLWIPSMPVWIPGVIVATALLVALWVPTTGQKSTRPLATGYAWWCMALVVSFVMAPATLAFCASYDCFVERAARADLRFRARALRDRPADLERAVAGEPVEILIGFAFGIDSMGPGAEAPMDLKSVSSRPMANVLPMLLDDTLAYEAYEAPVAKETWSRNAHRLWLTPTDPAAPTLAAFLPALVARSSRPAATMRLLAAYVPFLLLGFLASRASLDRLWFIRVIERSKDDPDLTTHAKPEDVWGKLNGKEDRRLLGQLAVDGCLPPHPSVAWRIRNLIAAGALCPSTLTMSRELEQYVQERIKPQDEAKWDTASKGSTWSALRAPLATAVVALCAVVGSSAPELAAAGALTPAVATGLPVLLRVVARALGPASSA